MTPVGLAERERVLCDYQPTFSFQEIARLISQNQAEPQMEGGAGDFILNVIRHGKPARVVYANIGYNTYHANEDLTNNEHIPILERLSLEEAVNRELERVFSEPLFEPGN